MGHLRSEWAGGGQLPAGRVREGGCGARTLRVGEVGRAWGTYPQGERARGAGRARGTYPPGGRGREGVGQQPAGWARESGVRGELTS